MLQSSTLSSSLPPSGYIDSLSSPESKPLCIVINFLVLMSISLRSTLVQYEKCLEYLIRKTAELFITLMGFLQQTLVSESFFILRYSFQFFSLYIIDLGFNKIDPYSVVVYCCQERFSFFLRFLFISQLQVFLYKILTVFRLNIQTVVTIF